MKTIKSRKAAIKEIKLLKIECLNTINDGYFLGDRLKKQLVREITQL